MSEAEVECAMQNCNRNGGLQTSNKIIRLIKLTGKYTQETLPLLGAHATTAY